MVTLYLKVIHKLVTLYLTPSIITHEYVVITMSHVITSPKHIKDGINDTQSHKTALLIAYFTAQSAEFAR